MEEGRLQLYLSVSVRRKTSELENNTGSLVRRCWPVLGRINELRCRAYGSYKYITVAFKGRKRGISTRWYGRERANGARGSAPVLFLQLTVPRLHRHLCCVDRQRRSVPPLTLRVCSPDYGPRLPLALATCAPLRPARAWSRPARPAAGAAPARRGARGGGLRRVLPLAPPRAPCERLGGGRPDRVGLSLFSTSAVRRLLMVEV